MYEVSCSDQLLVNVVLHDAVIRKDLGLYKSGARLYRKQ